MAKNVIVQTFIQSFSSDFMIKDIKKDEEDPLIFGKPSVQIAQMTINVDNKQLKVKTHDQKVVFQQFD